MKWLRHFTNLTRQTDVEFLHWFPPDCPPCRDFFAQKLAGTAAQPMNRDLNIAFAHPKPSFESAACSIEDQWVVLNQASAGPDLMPEAPRLDASYLLRREMTDCGSANAFQQEIVGLSYSPRRGKIIDGKIIGKAAERRER